MFVLRVEMYKLCSAIYRTTLFTTLLRISLICAFRIFSRFRMAFDGRRSTQAWLQNLAPFQDFINTSVIQDKTLTIYINFGKFKLEKAPNFVTRPASNVDRPTPFGSEKKFGMHISVKCVVIDLDIDIVFHTVYSARCFIRLCSG